MFHLLQIDSICSVHMSVKAESIDIGEQGNTQIRGMIRE